MAKKKHSPAEDSQGAASGSFETAMEELSMIVSRLESGNESLDDSLQQYERGMALLRDCHRRLDSAAQRIEIVTRMGPDGDVATSPFDSTSTLNRSRPTDTSVETDDDESGSGSLF